MFRLFMLFFFVLCLFSCDWEYSGGGFSNGVVSNGIVSGGGDCFGFDDYKVYDKLGVGFSYHTNDGFCYVTNFVGGVVDVYDGCVVGGGVFCGDYYASFDLGGIEFVGGVLRYGVLVSNVELLVGDRDVGFAGGRVVGFYGSGGVSNGFLSVDIDFDVRGRVYKCLEGSEVFFSESGRFVGYDVKVFK